MSTVNRKSWDEFRRTGLFLLLNQFLHIFGWAIVFKIENNVVSEVFPARVKFRGFDNESQSEAYTKVTQYMSENAYDLLKEIED